MPEVTDTSVCSNNNGNIGYKSWNNDDDFTEAMTLEIPGPCKIHAIYMHFPYGAAGSSDDLLLVNNITTVLSTVMTGKYVPDYWEDFGNARVVVGSDKTATLTYFNTNEENFVISVEVECV